ncbi:group I truncated hemoglobin [Coraliomargarita parva]|uniref:group I truncated hemoglobin n=1 Tax=Coraliomargarita parva TaxID=3014050 RepID=UPI0022B4FD94|nr:group 1 truncated hemoglobin [Coraliomargarita parva]
MKVLANTLRAAVLVALLVSSPVRAVEPVAAPSLYERLGGLAPISVVVNDFIDVVNDDPLLNANPAIAEARKRVPPPYLKYHVTAMVCQATGGPCTYEGRSMKDAHAHLNINEKEWDRMVLIFKEVLLAHEVAKQEIEELVAIVESTKADIVVMTAK